MTIKIIGTSHIAQQSIKEIEQAFASFKPEIVTVELDVGRANSLLSEEKSKINLTAIIQIGVRGYVFAKVGQFVQQKLGKFVGVSPGSEMKVALNLAKKNKIDVALIDQPRNAIRRNIRLRTCLEQLFFQLDLV